MSKAATLEESYWDEQQTLIIYEEKYSDSVSHCNKVCSYSDEMMVSEFDGIGLQQGQYAFPFKVGLPEGLPSTLGKISGIISRIFSLLNSYPCKIQAKKNIHKPLRYCSTLRNPFASHSVHRPHKNSTHLNAVDAAAVTAL